MRIVYLFFFIMLLFFGAIDLFFIRTLKQSEMENWKKIVLLCVAVVVPVQMLFWMMIFMMKS